MVKQAPDGNPFLPPLPVFMISDVQSMFRSDRLTKADYQNFSAFGQRYQLEAQWKARHGVCDGSVESLNKSFTSNKPDAASNHLLCKLMEYARDINNETSVVSASNLLRRHSTLPRHQHQRYLELLEKKANAQKSGLSALLALTSEDQKEWQKLHDSVRTEQEHFFLFFQAEARRNSGETYAYVPESAQLHYDRRLQACQNDAYRLYPRYFEPSAEVKLSQNSQLKTKNAMLKHEQQVATHGNLQELDASALPTDIPLNDTGSAVVNDSIASTDLEAERLADLYACDAVISASTLAQLFDSCLDTRPELDNVQPWAIPVKTRVVSSPHRQNESHKCVYFDSTLLAGEALPRGKIAEAATTSIHNYLEKEEETKGQTSYHVWTIGDKRLLIRCNTSFRLPKDKAKAEEKRMDPISIFAKVDYTPLGINEQISPSEKRRMWLHSWLRGSSHLLLARISPQNKLMSWKKMSLSSLLYHSISTDAEGHRVLDSFDPTDHFSVISEVIDSVCSLPSGDYLVRPEYKWRSIQIYSSCSSPDSENSTTSILDLYSRVNNVVSDDPLSHNKSLAKSIGYVLPKWTYIENVVPYTFFVATYCQGFLKSGVCPRMSAGRVCTNIHFRLTPVPRNTAKGSFGGWQLQKFESLRANSDATAAFKNKGKLYGKVVKPNFPLCRNIEGLNDEDLYTLKKCNRDSCKSVHMSLHDLLEILAYQELEHAKTLRRTSKKTSRQKRKHEQVEK